MNNRGFLKIAVVLIIFSRSQSWLLGASEQGPCDKAWGKVLKMPDKVFISKHNRIIADSIRTERVAQIEAFLRDEIIYPYDKFRTHRPGFVNFFVVETKNLAVRLHGERELLAELPWAAFAHELIVQTFLEDHTVSELVRTGNHAYFHFDETLQELFAQVLKDRQVQPLLARIKIFAVYQYLLISLQDLALAFPFLTIDRQYLLDWANVIAKEVTDVSALKKHPILRGINQVVRGDDQQEVKSHLVVIDKIYRIVAPLAQRPRASGLMDSLNDITKHKIYKMGRYSLHPLYEGESRLWCQVPAVGDMPPVF